MSILGRLVAGLMLLLAPGLQTRLAHAETSCAPQLADPPVQFSGFFWSIPGGGPYPVLGSDDRAHLAYVLTITNAARTRGTLTAILPVDPTRDYTPSGTNAIHDLDGTDRTGQLGYLFGRPAEGSDVEGEPPLPPSNFFTVLPRGGTGTMLMDVTYPSLAEVPPLLSHRLTISFPTKGGGNKVETVTGSPVAVNCAPAIVLHSPLRGDGWWNANGCCATTSDHRGANFPINGDLVPTQQFAVDWVQIRSDGQCCAGDPRLLSSWPFYGTLIHAAGAGTVVETRSDLPDQIPTQAPTGITIDTALGNHVIIDMGGGRYAFYAHLRPGSLPVDIVPGAKVAVGDVIGLLGNSGNSDAPHLHFQVMDKPHVFQGTSVPYVIDDMDYQGRPAGTGNATIDAYFRGQKLRIDTTGARHLHERMPLTESVFGFH